MNLEEMEYDAILDHINSPAHYTKGSYEVWDVIKDWKLNYFLGNAIKYIARCEHKNNKIEDLKKAVAYLEKEIKNSEKKA